MTTCYWPTKDSTEGTSATRRRQRHASIAPGISSSLRGRCEYIRRDRAEIFAGDTSRWRMRRCRPSGRNRSRREARRASARGEGLSSLLAISATGAHLSPIPARPPPDPGPTYRPDLGPISAAGVSPATLMTSASARTRSTATPPSPSVAIAPLSRMTPRASASVDRTYPSTALFTAPASRSPRTHPTTTPTYRVIRTASLCRVMGGRHGCLTRSCMDASPWSSRRAPA